MKYLTFNQIMHTNLRNNGYDPTEWEIRSLPIVKSTNDYVSYLFEMNYKQVIVLSRVQENGRGRNGNSWESPDGGIWLSIGIKKQFKPIELSTPVVQAVKTVIDKFVKCEIKAPNDILINGKKLAGVLVEAKTLENKMQEAIIGIGVNVLNELPDNIKDIATRLKDHSNANEIPEIAADIAIAVINKLKNENII